ncbi:MAG: lysophospholipid acyltransferase family protein [Deltaproteobacteria bacterium]|nr:lysophospholipid acyltransferase family protein [Deltaproteobacteria bacterium]
MIEKLLSLFVGLVSLPSDGAVRTASRVLGALWFHGIRYRRGVILANLGRAFPELEARERRRLGKLACTHLVLALFETLRIERALAEGIERRVTLRGLEHYRAAKAQGRGVLVLTGHLGSFELCAGALARALGPDEIGLVVKRLSPGVQEVITRIRRASGIMLIEAERSMQQILRQLREGRMVAFVLDQNATRQLGVFVDFFGAPASTMSGLALLALRKGCPVIPVAIWREGGQHVLELHPPLTIEARVAARENGAAPRPSADPPGEAHESRESSIVALTQQFTRFIESQIRAHPEQWLWTHRRWKTRPIPEDAAPRPSS